LQDIFVDVLVELAKHCFANLKSCCDIRENQGRIKLEVTGRVGKECQHIKRMKK
jgi:hypothetical protein